MDLDRTGSAVSAAQDGDSVALDYLYVRFADDVRAHVRCIVRTRQDAEEVTQRVFVELREAIRHYDPDGAPFECWLLRMARNAALAHHHARGEPPSPAVYPDDGDQSVCERRDLVRRVFGRLPAEQREVIVLSHALALSPGEIALRLGRSEADVHDLHERGCRTLARALEQAGALEAVARPTVDP